MMHRYQRPLRTGGTNRAWPTMDISRVQRLDHQLLLAKFRADTKLQMGENRLRRLQEAA